MTERLAAAALVLLAAWPSHAAAQQSDLAAECSAAPLDSRARCIDAMLAFQAAQGGVGLLGTGGGSVLPGNASTLGRRFGSQPRTAWNLQFSGVRMGMPGVAESSAFPAPEDRAVVSALIATAGVGLFDGFSPAPTVGGVLAIDGILSANASFLPSSQGFQDNVFGYGIGVRVGLLRESFTLPGVSVSGILRGSSTVRIGDPDAAEAADMAFDLSTLSVRGTVGKDFLVFGLLGGLGYDRYRSDADIAVHTPIPGEVIGSTFRAAPRGFTTSRMVFFGGATLTYLVAQFSAEGGWARGYDEEPAQIGGELPGAHDPTDGSPYLTLSARLIL